MRIEFVPKTKSTLVDVTVLSLKMGQTEVKPALVISFKTKVPNTFLNQLNKLLRPTYYEKDGQRAKSQAGIDGVAKVVDDLPQLTELGEKLGPIGWPEEQSGSTLKLYWGVDTKKPAYTLKDGTVRKVKCECHDGGTVDVHWQFYTADVDAETIGEIAVLKSHDIDLEMTPPEPAQQQELDDAAAKSGRDNPEKAMARAHGAGEAATTH